MFGSKRSGAADRARQVVDPVLELVEEAREAFPGLSRRAERAFQDSAERLRRHSRDAADHAEEHLETARTYVVERVRERPLATTLAILGAGFLLGLFVAGRRR